MAADHGRAKGRAGDCGKSTVKKREIPDVRPPADADAYFKLLHPCFDPPAGPMNPGTGHGVAGPTGGTKGMAGRDWQSLCDRPCPIRPDLS
jgi:hypothetical protein